MKGEFILTKAHIQSHKRDSLENHQAPKHIPILIFSL